MKIREQELNYLEVKKLAEAWCEEYGMGIYDTWHHPYKAQGENESTVLLVLWSLHTERRASVEGMRLHFERFMAHRQTAKKYQALQLSEDLWQVA